ncbi:MAG TPA: GxxExxY protein [Flavisolibacter sp.]|jgi:iron complex transport system substrate-binding protein|nr:GxxExxY protein [Flavisolibacter sp.]
MQIDDITYLVIDAALRIHSTVGPGCYEKVYEEILYYELHKQGLNMERQLIMPIQYEDLHIKNAYRIDLLVEGRLILEVKSAETVIPIHFKQVMTYLKLMHLKNGMILNFKVNKMKEGIHRVFNNFGS